MICAGVKSIFPSILGLSVSNNLLSQIPQSLPFSSLTHLDFSFNQLTIFFERLINLEILDFCYNKLTSLNDQIFKITNSSSSSSSPTLVPPPLPLLLPHLPTLLLHPLPLFLP
jgi:Leucine-rich repeat (LRR) protein